jgi:hypothetical protein
MKRFAPTIISALSVLTPLVAYAATSKKLSDVIADITGYLDQVLKLLMGFAVVMFVWYVIRYFIMQSDDTKRTEAAQYVMWSLIGFFIILSLWGLVNILISTFNLGSNSPGSLTNVQNIFPQ